MNIQHVRSCAVRDGWWVVIVCWLFQDKATQNWPMRHLTYLILLWWNGRARCLVRGPVLQAGSWDIRHRWRLWSRDVVFLTLVQIRSNGLIMVIWFATGDGTHSNTLNLIKYSQLSFFLVIFICDLRRFFSYFSVVNVLFVSSGFLKFQSPLTVFMNRVMYISILRCCRDWCGSGFMDCCYWLL